VNEVRAEMPLGMLGKKLGMTTAFDDEGRAVAVTVLELPPNRLTQVKTPERDGYAAVQLGLGEKKRPTKPETGHAAKAGVSAPAVLREFRLGDVESYKAGDVVDISIFEGVGAVDIRARSKGRGFAGVIKRHGFHRGPKTHGSKAYRRPKSIGASATPSKVYKGKKMPGHMGHGRLTAANLKVFGLDAEKSLLIVKGAAPGPNGGLVVVSPSRKSPRAEPKS
jgi:large subunit ribosomal protein L3